MPEQLTQQSSNNSRAIEQIANETNWWPRFSDAKTATINCKTRKAGRKEVPMSACISAVQHLRRLRGGSQSHLLRASDGASYVTKFQN